jgi:hypothetical protein
MAPPAGGFVRRVLCLGDHKSDSVRLTAPVLVITAPVLVIDDTGWSY